MEWETVGGGGMLILLCSTIPAVSVRLYFIKKQKHDCQVDFFQRILANHKYGSDLKILTCRGIIEFQNQTVQKCIFFKNCQCQISNWRKFLIEFSDSMATIGWRYNILLLMMNTWKGRHDIDTLELLGGFLAKFSWKSQIQGWMWWRRVKCMECGSGSISWIQRTFCHRC